MTDIAKHHFDNPRDFLNALRRSNPEWRGTSHLDIPWIFRGQKCDTYSLQAAAWRKSIQDDCLYQHINRLDLDANVKALSESCTNIRNAISETFLRPLVVQLLFEHHVILKFVELIDDLGLAIPGPEFLDFIEFNFDAIVSHTMNKKPYTAFHPIRGMAQHHGLPTRLLDWTYNPLIAAFFAADGIDPSSPGNIVVWAIDRKQLTKKGCNEFHVRRSHIGFLHAQEGLFTYISAPEFNFLNCGEWPTLQNRLLPESFRCYTLPKSKAKELLELLWIERISRAHLMPTLDNVSNQLKKNWHNEFESVTNRM